MQKLLSTQEVSQLLGSRDPKGRMVRNLWKRGEITGARIGQKILFTADSVDDYIRKRFRDQN